MLIKPDESVHAQTQDNNNHNTGKDAVQHVAVFDAQQIIAESFLGTDPFADNGAADAVGRGNLETG